MANIAIINKKSRSVYDELYKDNVKWRRFAYGICKNDFVKSYLREEQKSICKFCYYRIIIKDVVHHVDYDNFCTYDKSLDDKDKIPDCESCCEVNIEQFAKCMSKIALVHQGCNKRIHDLRLVIYG